MICRQGRDKGVGNEGPELDTALRRRLGGLGSGARRPCLWDLSMKLGRRPWPANSHSSKCFGLERERFNLVRTALINRIFYSRVEDTTPHKQN